MSFILLGILNSQVAGGAAGAYDLLETQVLTSSASSVEFTGLGSYSDYKHLQIRATTRSDRVSAADALIVQLNADTGSNYAYHQLLGDGSSVSSQATTSSTSMYSEYIPGSTETADIFQACVIDVLDFSSSTKNTTLRTLAGVASSVSSIGLFSGLWVNTASVTSVALKPLIGPNFVTGSRFSLYGVR